MVSFLAECISVGVEILQVRFQTSMEAKIAISKSELNKPRWISSVLFYKENATSNKRNPFTHFDDHCTHIFSYNYIQVKHDHFMRPIVKHLNKTNFKLLAWCAD